MFLTKTKPIIIEQYLLPKEFKGTHLKCVRLRFPLDWSDRRHDSWAMFRNHVMCLRLLAFCYSIGCCEWIWFVILFLIAMEIWVVFYYLGKRVGPADRTAPGFWFKCREQKPRRWDSFEQLMFEHSLRHCFPLNFLRTPDSDCTTSPFLKRCGVAAWDLGVAGWDRGVNLWSSRLDVLPRLCTLLRLLLPDSFSTDKQDGLEIIHSDQSIIADYLHRWESLFRVVVRHRFRSRHSGSFVGEFDRPWQWDYSLTISLWPNYYQASPAAKL